MPESGKHLPSVLYRFDQLQPRLLHHRHHLHALIYFSINLIFIITRLMDYECLRLVYHNPSGKPGTKPRGEQSLGLIGFAQRPAPRATTKLLDQLGQY